MNDIEMINEDVDDLKGEYSVFIYKNYMRKKILI